MIHSHKGAAVEGHREIQLNAVRALLVGNRDSQALGFVFQLPLKDQVLQNLLCVEALQLPGHLIAALNLTELLADILHRNRLVPHLGDRVCRNFARSRSLRNQVKQHTGAKKYTRRAEKDALHQFASIFWASHPMILHGR